MKYLFNKIVFIYLQKKRNWNDYKVNEFMKTNVVYDNLLKYNIKPSVQRMAIMEYLMKHFTHPSVDEIYTALSSRFPTLSRTTVYNTLKLFVENGAVQMLTIDEKMTCFDGDLSTHAHFLCKQCGVIYDFPLSDSVKDIIGTTASEGHSITEAHQYYKGVCRKCLEKK